MKILYLSCHSVLEWQEASIFNDLGHEWYSLHGSYQNPTRPIDPKRPAINAPFNQHLTDVARQCSQDNIHEELLEWADVIITMHRLDWLKNNWDKIRAHSVVPVWRTIGQSIASWEDMARPLVEQGLKIVRYSPMEERIPGFAGSDALVRFGVDPNLPAWRGGDNRVHVFGQAIKRRGDFLSFNTINKATTHLPRVAYGPQNEDISWSAGALEYEDLLDAYARANAMIYAGTVPASYTLGFIEALMVGTPMVCLGKELFNSEKHFPGHDLYEIPNIISHAQNGFIANSEAELKTFVGQLLKNPDLRSAISAGARQTARELFDFNKTKQDWEKFLSFLER